MITAPVSPSLVFPNVRGLVVGWTPFLLGTSILAWWDAERTDLITQSGGSVSSWKDCVVGYDAVQATSSSKPTYSATSFNMRPGVTADGVDDELTVAPVPAGIPIGATPCEFWAVLDQTAAPGDASIRIALGVGGGSTVNRYFARTVSGGANRSLIAAGDGSLQKAALGTGDFSGRHVLRSQITGTVIQSDLDGVPGSPTAGVPATSNTRLRLFGNTSASVGSAFFQGTFSAALITQPLDVQQAAQLRAYLTRRLL